MIGIARRKGFGVASWASYLSSFVCFCILAQSITKRLASVETAIKEPAKLPGKITSGGQREVRDVGSNMETKLSLSRNDIPRDLSKRACYNLTRSLELCCSSSQLGLLCPRIFTVW
jgi:hypothetical protein